MVITSLRDKRMQGWVSKEEKWRMEREVEAAAIEEKNESVCCVMPNVTL